MTALTLPRVGWRVLREAPGVAVAAALLLILALAALLAPWIAPQNPYDMGAVSIMDGRLPPGSRSDTGLLFLFGSDDQGRDRFTASESFGECSQQVVP